MDVAFHITLNGGGIKMLKVELLEGKTKGFTLFLKTVNNKEDLPLSVNQVWNDIQIGHQT